MPFRIFLKGDDALEASERVSMPRGREVRFRPVKVGFSGGLALCFFVLLLSLLSNFGIFESFANLVFEAHGINPNFGPFVFVLAGLYAFLEGFVVTTIFASVYKWVFWF